jgi:hypothetical protein
MGSSSSSSSKESIRFKSKKETKKVTKKRRHTFSGTVASKKQKASSDVDVEEVDDFEQEKLILFKMKALLDRRNGSA